MQGQENGHEVLVQENFYLSKEALSPYCAETMKTVDQDPYFLNSNT